MVQVYKQCLLWGLKSVLADRTSNYSRIPNPDTPSIQITLFQSISGSYYPKNPSIEIRLMDKILHYLKDPKLWELWYIPSYGSCRILSINRSTYFGLFGALGIGLESTSPGFFWGLGGVGFRGLGFGGLGFGGWGFRDLAM